MIAAYEQLLEQSRRILECAERADWDGIFTLKSQGLIDAAYLRRAEAQAKLDDAGQQRKFELMRQIMELDGQVSSFLHARQNDLGQLMQINRRKSDLNTAYRVPSNSVIPISHYLYHKNKKRVQATSSHDTLLWNYPGCTKNRVNRQQIVCPDLLSCIQADTLEK
ncbi:flagellar protein FliT [Pseudomonas sp. NA13]